MMIFFGHNYKVAISLARVYTIQQYKGKISIFYENGESYQTDEGKTALKISKCVLTYETEKEAIDEMRDFYAACRDHDGCYYFGTEKPFNEEYLWF